jgi:hypothetical protein
VANLHIQPIQSLDAPELSLYCTLRRVEEHERAGVLVATNAKISVYSAFVNCGVTSRG